jgi:hypothetical protein
MLLPLGDQFICYEIWILKCGRIICKVHRLFGQSSIYLLVLAVNYDNNLHDFGNLVAEDR